VSPDAVQYFAAIRTRTKRLAAMVADGRRHPVLLFSPGYGLTPRSYTSFIEEMASHGWVVVSVAHTFYDVIVTFADGTTAKATHASGDAGAFIEDLQVWVGDTKLAVDALASIDANDPDGLLQGRLDLDRIGAFGHSFGGAASIAATGGDARVRAAVNLDGTIFGINGASDAGANAGLGIVSLPSPFLIFRSDRAEDVTFAGAYRLAKSAAYDLLLEDSVHMSFSDMPIIKEQYLGRPDPGLGTIAPERSEAAIRAYLVAFFDQCLGAPGTRPDFESGLSDYPEVDFDKMH
jgi:pimeloyl-ACP methyl ester carboxylesterase